MSLVDQDLVDAFRAERDIEERQFFQRTAAATGFDLAESLFNIKTDLDASEATERAIQDQISDLEDLRDEEVDIEFSGESAQQQFDTAARGVSAALSLDPTRAAEGIQALGRETSRVQEEGELAAATQKELAEAEKAYKTTRAIGDLNIKKAEEKAKQRTAKRQKGLAALKAGVQMVAATPDKTAGRALEDKASRLGKRAMRLQQAGKKEKAQELFKQGEKAQEQADLLKIEQIRRSRALSGLGSYFSPYNRTSATGIGEMPSSDIAIPDLKFKGF